MNYKLMISILCCAVVCGCSNLKEVTENDVESGEDFITLDKATNEPFTGVVVKHYPDGKIESKESYKNGQHHGPYMTWDKNGQIGNHFEYIHGKRGKLKCWYPDGTLFIDADMNEDSGSGYLISYYSSGKKWTEQRWNGDTEIQTEKAWLKDGRLIAEGSCESFNVRKKNKNGTFCDFEYEIPVIEKYSQGNLIAKTDLEGNPLDVSKLRKKTEDELTKEGYGMPIGCTAEFK